jgi:hypothetical protein
MPRASLIPARAVGPVVFWLLAVTVWSAPPALAGVWEGRVVDCPAPGRLLVETTKGVREVALAGFSRVAAGRAGAAGRHAFLRTFMRRVRVVEKEPGDPVLAEVWFAHVALDGPAPRSVNNEVLELFGPSRPGPRVRGTGVAGAHRMLKLLQESGEHPGYSITVSMSRKRLWLFSKTPEGESELVADYEVAVPRHEADDPLGVGRVTRIDMDPWWHPPASIREEARQKGVDLPRSVPPGHALNPMGVFKIYLSHNKGGHTSYRIHGTRRPELVGRRVSHGCIRMRNEEGLKLAQMINVGTKVLILP